MDAILFERKSSWLYEVYNQYNRMYMWINYVKSHAEYPSVRIFHVWHSASHPFTSYLHALFIITLWPNGYSKFTLCQYQQFVVARQASGQIRLAASTTSASLRFTSSSVTWLPSLWEANPHWGLMQSLEKRRKVCHSFLQIGADFEKDTNWFNASSTDRFGSPLAIVWAAERTRFSRSSTFSSYQIR